MTTASTAPTCNETTSREMANYWADHQTQSPLPIGSQTSIPGGVFDMKLSWDRTASYFRLEIPKVDGVWHFKKLQGQVQITKTDSKTGRIYLRGEARLDEETLTLYRDEDSKPHPVVKGYHLPKTNNRLCYYRQEQLWRLRDERLTREIFEATRDMNAAMSDSSTLKLVKGYVGDWACIKPADDLGAHCFHGPDGWTIIDHEGVCHLYDPQLDYGLDG